MLLLVLAALVVFGIIEMVLVEAERFGWATFSLLAVGALVYWPLGLVDWLGLVHTHGWGLLIYVGVYIGAGIVWSFVKWFSFLMRMRDRYRQYVTAYLEEKGLPADTKLEGDVLQGAKEYIQHQYDREFGRNALWEKPKAKQNKGRITAWMCWWPFSLIGTFLNDPVRRFFNMVFNWFKGLYQQMADRVYRDHPELK